MRHIDIARYKSCRPVIDVGIGIHMSFQTAISLFANVTISSYLSRLQKSSRVFTWKKCRQLALQHRACRQELCKGIGNTKNSSCVIVISIHYTFWRTFPTPYVVKDFVSRSSRSVFNCNEVQTSFLSTGRHFNIKTVFLGVEIPIIKVKLSHLYNGNFMWGRQHLHIETPPPPRGVSTGPSTDIADTYVRAIPIYH